MWNSYSFPAWDLIPAWDLLKYILLIREELRRLPLTMPQYVGFAPLLLIHVLPWASRSGCSVVIGSTETRYQQCISLKTHQFPHRQYYSRLTQQFLALRVVVGSLFHGRFWGCSFVFHSVALVQALCKYTSNALTLLTVAECPMLKIHWKLSGTI